MAVSEGLKTSLNAIREISSEIYHRYVPIIEDETSIAQFATPILENTDVRDEFLTNLIKRIVYTQFEIKYFKNPLQVLEGDSIPLGYRGQELYVNPAKGRKFNAEDFAGLLAKYTANVKVQYFDVNMDIQYPLTVLRSTLKQAFVSWGDLESFINQLSNSLYNGCYIDEYRYTKNIVSSAYAQDYAITEVITAPTTKELAKDFITKARTLFLNFQTPSSNYNSWAKVKQDEDSPIITWTNPEDIVFMVRNDIRAFLDVNVLAEAFNMDKTVLLGNILTVDNFDAYDDDGEKIFDGSSIIAGIFDKSWFRIKKQDMFLDTFYNPNNRTMQYYLNNIKMYNFSLFANGVIFATANPPIGALKVTSVAGETEGKTKITVKPTVETGHTYKYKTGATVTMPDLDDVISGGYSNWDGTSEISATAGHKIVIVEVDKDNKAKKAGQTTVVVNAGT